MKDTDKTLSDSLRPRGAHTISAPLYDSPAVYIYGIGIEKSANQNPTGSRGVIYRLRDKQRNKAASGLLRTNYSIAQYPCYWKLPSKTSSMFATRTSATERTTPFQRFGKLPEKSASSQRLQRV